MAESSSSSHDMEKNEKTPPEAGVGNISYEKRPDYVYEDGAVPGEAFVVGDSFYARAQRFAAKFKVELRGIERVPEDERHDSGFKAMLNIFTMWLSANLVISSFAIGVVANSLFYLGWADAILVCLFFNLLSIMPVCFFSCFGPAFGLRQMVLSRFWFGWHGVKLIALFNCLACIGWSSVNVIVGAQLINAVNNDVPGWAGIVIIAFCTILVSLFGYKVVHAYEFWSWIPTLIVFFIIVGEFAHSGDFQNLGWGGVGTSEMGNCLSFGATVFGFGTGWTSYAADYTVYQPANTNKKKLFFWTWLGLIIPLLFCEFLGIALMTATGIGDIDENAYSVGYAQSGNGGLIAVVLAPLGTFGKFCLVLLALSIIANNCPNIYSVSLTVQVFGRWTQKVPRFIWTFVATGIYIAIAIPGYYHFEEILEDFMDFIGYWLAIYEGIALTEHFVYKRGFKGYNPEIYDHPDELPPGLAAIGAFCCGIAGMVTGMSETWYVGPLALKAGAAPYGGDVGFELGFAFSSFSYLILRYFEKKYFKR